MRRWLTAKRHPASYPKAVFLCTDVKLQSCHTWIRYQDHSPGCSFAIRNTCRCPATRCCKQPEILGPWDPPPPPVNEHNKFQYTVPSHIKVVRLIRAGRGSEAKKKRFFVTEGIWQRKPRLIQWASPLCMAVEWTSIYILRTMPVSNQLRKPGCDMWCQPVSNHLLDTESEFAFLDPSISKAQILVATPAHVGTMNSAYWAFSTFQSAFIWAIASVVLWSSFIWKYPLG